MGDAYHGVGPVLWENESLADVFLPLKNAVRVKYTCFDVSERYLVFGASSGSLFLFQRHPLQFLKLLPNKDGPISQVAFAHDDNIIGYGTERGLVVVIEHNVGKKVVHVPQRLQVSYDHKGSPVSALRWNTPSSRLFAGDTKGRVSVTNITSSKGRMFFQVPAVIIMRLDSKIVQLDFAQNKLVASTLTRCYLCNTLAEQYTQIGKKLRDGEFGACFYNSSRTQTPSIYATRPGSRIWEIDYQGLVINTHQFREALAIPPHRITFLDSSSFALADPHATYHPQNINFGPILNLGCKYLITWADAGIYIMDPVDASVVLWTDSIKGIRCLRTCQTEIYIWLSDGSFRHITLQSIDKFVAEMYNRREWVSCAEAAVHYEATLVALQARRYVHATMMRDLASHLIDREKPNLAQQVEAIAVQIEVESGSMSSSLSGRSSADSLSRYDSSPVIVRPSSDYASDSEELSRQSGSSISRRPPRCRTLSRTSGSPFQPVITNCLAPSPLSRSDSLTRSSPSPHLHRMLNGGEVDHLASERAVRKLSAESLRKSRTDKSPFDSKSPSPSRFAQSKMSLSYPSPKFKTGSLQDNRLIQTEKNSQSKKSLVAERSLHSTSFKSPTKIGMLRRKSTEKVDTSKLLDDQNIVKKEQNYEAAKLEKVTASPSSRVKLQIIDKPVGKVEHAPVTLNLSPILKKRMADGTMSSKSQLEKSDSSKTKGITFFFPYSPYMYQNMIDPMGEELSSTSGLVTIPTPSVSLSQLRNSLSSKLSSGKEVIRSTIEGLEDTIGSLKSNESHELLDVANSKALERNTLQLVVPEEPVVVRRQTVSESYSKEVQFMMAFRHNMMELPPMNLQRLLQLTHELIASDLENVTFKSKELLHQWLLTIEGLQDHISAAITSKIVQQIVDLKLNVGSVSKILQKSQCASRPEKKRNCMFGSQPDRVNNVGAIAESMTNNLIFAEDPFEMPKEDHENVSRLARLCFKLKMFEPDTSEICNGKAKDVVFASGHELANGSAIDEVTQRKNSKASMKLPNKYDFSPQSSEQCLKEWLESVRDLDCIDYSEQEQQLDVKSARFIRRFFHLFDPNEIYEILVNSKTSRFATWIALMEGCQEMFWNDELYRSLCEGRDNLGLVKQNKLELLAALKRLMECNPAAAIHFCVHNLSHITTMDVLFLCRLTENPLRWFELFFSRVTTSSTTPSVRSLHPSQHLLKDIMLDDEVCIHWIALILAKGQPMYKQLKCTCGYPCLWAHLWPWPLSPFLWQLLKRENRWSDIATFWCYLCGFWPGFLMLSKKDERHKQLIIDIVIQLGDVRLLSSSLDFGFLPTTKQTWGLLLSTVAKLHQHPDHISCLCCKAILHKKSPVMSPSDQFQKQVANVDATASALLPASEVDLQRSSKPPSITWSCIMQLILQHHEPSAALSLLKNTDELSLTGGSLSPDSLRTFMLASSLHYRKMSTSVGKSNKDSLYSTPNLQYVGSELHHLFQVEKQKEVRTTSSLSTELVLELTHRRTSFRCHWGAAVLLHGDCHACHLPLSLGTSTLVQGTIILFCGHSFHQGCLEKCVCITCKERTNR